MQCTLPCLLQAEELVEQDSAHQSCEDTEVKVWCEWQFHQFKLQKSENLKGKALACVLEGKNAA